MHERGRSRLLVIAIAAVAVIALGGIAALRLRGRGYRGTIRAVLKSSSVTSSGDFTDVIFLHHSTGDYLINQGGVRELLAENGYELWDHDYNGIGVTRPDGTPAGFHYRVPDDNTDPDGLARIFAQRAFKLPFNTLSGLLQHDVVIFKSCFPTSNITSDRQLEQYKEYYLSIRDTMDQHPDKVFIAMTPPPLIPAATDPEAASRARAFSDWLESDEYLGGHPNVFVFDFFDLLAEDDPAAPDYSMLREAYRYGSNSYPNRKANETIGPLFADFIVDAASAYREMENGH